MKIIKVDNFTVQCSPSGSRYTCHIVEHDMFFSTKIDDEETVIKKARFMVEAKERFLNDYPQYR